MILNSLKIMLADAATAAPAAAASGTTQPNPTAQMLNNVFLIALMGVIFYVVMIRPQSKKSKEHAALLKTVKAGDKIVTSSGIVGIVVSVKEKTVAIRSADTKLEILKSAVSEITDRSGESKPDES